MLEDGEFQRRCLRLAGSSVELAAAWPLAVMEDPRAALRALTLQIDDFLRLVLDTSQIAGDWREVGALAAGTSLLGSLTGRATESRLAVLAEHRLSTLEDALGGSAVAMVELHNPAFTVWRRGRGFTQQQLPAALREASALFLCATADDWLDLGVELKLITEELLQASLEPARLLSEHRTWGVLFASWLATSTSAHAQMYDNLSRIDSTELIQDAIRSQLAEIAPLHRGPAREEEIPGR